MSIIKNIIVLVLVYMVYYYVMNQLIISIREIIASF